MSASRDVKIRRATAKDAEAISRVHYAALDHDHLHDFYGAFFAIHPRKLIPRATAAALENPVNNFLVALDTDEVVGFIRWSIIPHARTQTIDSDGNAKEEQSRAERGSQQCQSPPLFAPKEHLKDLWHQFQYPREVEMDACYESAANGQRHVCKFGLLPIAEPSVLHCVRAAESQAPRLPCRGKIMAKGFPSKDQRPKAH